MKAFWLCLWLLACTNLSAQSWLFYNVENLFDTLNDANKHDEEFTPWGAKAYNSISYRLCLRQTARAINAASQSGFSSPIIGLCEVEDRSVLEDLVRHPGFQAHGPWRIVHYDSPDFRGIDCALLYKSNEVEILYTNRIRYSSDTLRSRDALFVRAVIQGMPCNTIVVHLPSKRGGAAHSAWKRDLAWKRIAEAIDTCNDPTIILGDFNDEVGMRQLQHFPTGWYPSAFKSTSGTYKYQGRWATIDGAIANFPLKSAVCHLPLLLEEDKKWGGHKPQRRWQGSFYKNGYSDHLPVHFSMVGGIGK